MQPLLPSTGAESSFSTRGASTHTASAAGTSGWLLPVVVKPMLLKSELAPEPMLRTLKV